MVGTWNDGPWEVVGKKRCYADKNYLLAPDGSQSSVPGKDLH